MPALTHMYDQHLSLSRPVQEHLQNQHTHLLGEPSANGGITVTVTITDVFSRSTIWS
jgi:hypothetical protein